MNLTNSKVNPLTPIILISFYFWTYLHSEIKMDIFRGVHRRDNISLVFFYLIQCCGYSFMKNSCCAPHFVGSVKCRTTVQVFDDRDNHTCRIGLPQSYIAVLDLRNDGRLWCNFHAVKATVLWNILFSPFAMVTQVHIKPNCLTFSGSFTLNFFRVWRSPCLSITLDPSLQVRRYVSSSSIRIMPHFPNM